MKNRGYNHFFEFLGHKDTPFIFFYGLECMHGPKVVKKKQKPKLFFFLLNLIKYVYFYIPFDFKLIALSAFMNIFAHVCILKKIDVFLLSQ
jgi:hypothetical protein